MTRHFEKAIDHLKREILSLSTLVEEKLAKSMLAVKNLDAVSAQSIADSDQEVDDKEVEIEEECLKILALYQPVAIDLRFVVAVLKINSDLERIGDLSVNIASRATALASSAHVTVPFDLNQFASKTKQLLRDSLQALINMDCDLAKKVCELDLEIDALYKATYQNVQKAIEKDPSVTNQIINYLSVARNLERVADHATNIAEDVVYMIEGEIIRHRLDKVKDS